METKDRILSIEEASTLLSVSQQTLRNWEANDILVPLERTEGGHRRYSEKQVIELRKRRMGNYEIILPNVPAKKILEMVEQFMATFKPEEKVYVRIEVDNVDPKVRIGVDSEDGFTSVSKTFKMEK